MESFGKLLRKYRKRCLDPLTDGPLSQGRFGELLGDYLGGAIYSYAAVSNWELDKSKIHADDRQVLVAVVNVLHACGGLAEQEEADRLLYAGNYRALDDFEARQVFPEILDEKTGGGEGQATIGQAIISPATSSKAMHPETALTAERRNQLILLRKVRNFWGRGVLEQSVQDATLIDLSRQRCDDAVEHPLRNMVGPGAYQSPDSQPATLLALLRDADNALLILGDPGSGKTTTLLQLTEALCQLAENEPSEPVPVVLNLVSWAEKREPIANWIVEDLMAKYQIPRRLGRRWLADDALALLLDGFDEVPVRYRAECARGINTFRETHGLAVIVVCSRTEAYKECGLLLRMGGATQLCPFAPEQVDDYLRAGGPELSGLRSAVQKSSTWQEMAESPLMLRVMCAAYAGIGADELLGQDGDDAHQLEGAQRRLFETYVQRMFLRGGQKQHYSTANTRGWLSWLAGQMNKHSQSVFLIEQLQPSWLPTRGWRWAYLLTTWFFNGLYGGLIMWLLMLLLKIIVDWPATNGGTIVLMNIALGIWAGVLNGLTYERRQGADEDIKGRGRPGRQQLSAVGVSVFLLTVLFYRPPDSLWWAFAWGMAEAVMFVIITRYNHGRTYNTEIRAVEALSWSWRSAAKGLMYGLLLGIASEIIETVVTDYNGVLTSMLTFGAAGLILGGLRGSRVQVKNRPNEGILLSIRNGLVAGLLTAVVMSLVTLGAMLLQNQRATNHDLLWRPLLTGLMLGLFALFLFGLGNAVKHYLVRLVLWYKRRIPWRLTALLNDSARLILMRKVGGGYIYVHRMLQDYLMTAGGERQSASEDRQLDSILAR